MPLSVHCSQQMAVVHDWYVNNIIIYVLDDRTVVWKFRSIGIDFQGLLPDSCEPFKVVPAVFPGPKKFLLYFFVCKFCLLNL